jgi:hypothetical protein
VAIFLAFQSQSFHTDDVTGHAIPEIVEKRVSIVAALVNPEAGSEISVTILNATPDPIMLDGWKLVDRKKIKIGLTGTIDPGSAMRFPITQGDFKLPKTGGIITLLDDKGLKVDGVSYTEENASREGWTIVF